MSGEKEVVDLFCALRSALKNSSKTTRHIPDAQRDGAKTLCGRSVFDVRCIDLSRDCIDDAECKACQRVDDARTLKAYQRETKVES